MDRDEAEVLYERDRLDLDEARAVRDEAKEDGWMLHIGYSHGSYKTRIWGRAGGTDA